MGGHGSTRWGWNTARMTVERSRKLSILPFHSGIRSVEGTAGTITAKLDWASTSRDEEEFEVIIKSDGAGLLRSWLNYKLLVGGTTANFHFYVGLESSILFWGARRWWWICPKCEKRVATLFLPPQAVHFLCRQCYGLTYRSCQESGTHRFMVRMVTPELMELYPTLTPMEIARLLFCNFQGRKIPRSLEKKVFDSVSKWTLNQFEEKQDQQSKGQEIVPDRHENYLSTRELSERSGLSAADIAALQDARILLPDTPGGLYRPKLVGWAGKLAFLLREGWSIEEIKTWARQRWQSPNPREWPPKR